MTGGLGSYGGWAYGSPATRSATDSPNCFASRSSDSEGVVRGEEISLSQKRQDMGLATAVKIADLSGTFAHELAPHWEAMSRTDRSLLTS